MAKYALLTSLSLSLLVTAACASGHQAVDEQDADRSQYRQDPDDELVEITIRLPDGRIIKRKEPRIASKVDPKDAGVDGNAPPIVRKQAPASSQKVTKTKSDVTGGSNSSSVKTSGGGGGGGGSSSSSGGGGGGGGGSSDRGSSNGSNGGGSGGPGNDSIPLVQPDTDFTVRMYAWDQTGISFGFIQEAIVADPRGKSPETLAERVAASYRASGQDKFVIRFWKELEPAERHPFDLSNARELIQSGGYAGGLASYWSRFAHALRNTGLTPDYLIFDQEEGVSFWHVPVSQRRRFFGELLSRDQAHLSALPPTMRGMSVEQFLNYRSPGSTAAFNDYNQFAKDFRADFLRRVFYDAFRDAYGVGIPTSNYEDIHTGFTVTNRNNREMNTGSMAGISAPVAYLDRRDNAARYARTTKDHRWNILIDQLNEVRSSAQPGLTTPWVAPPGYGRFGPDTWSRPGDLDEEFALWKVHMAHMLAMGIDTFILWNPSPRFNPSAATADAMMDGWLRQNRRVSTPQLRDLPEIPLDADYIETNGFVTTYQEYLEIMNLSE